MAQLEYKGFTCTIEGEVGNYTGTIEGLEHEVVEGATQTEVKMGFEAKVDNYLNRGNEN